MNQVNVVNMDKLIDFLKELSKKKFDFSEVVSEYHTDKNELVCGTVCCAVGWFPAIFKGVKWDGYGIDMGGDNDFCSIANSILGISYRISGNLFEPNEQDAVHPDLVNCGNAATADKVAKMLEHFMELVKEGKIEGHEVKS